VVRALFSIIAVHQAWLLLGW